MGILRSKLGWALVAVYVVAGQSRREPSRAFHRSKFVTADLAPAERAALETIVRRLETAWNAMDGSAFAASFAPDAEFVNIRGEYFRGRNAIAAGHAALFQGIYAAPGPPR